jgi:hypothetical protein
MSVFIAFLELSGLAPALRTEAGERLSYLSERKKSSLAAALGHDRFTIKKYIRMGFLSISKNLTAAGF